MGAIVSCAVSKTGISRVAALWRCGTRPRALGRGFPSAFRRIVVRRCGRRCGLAPRASTASARLDDGRGGIDRRCIGMCCIRGRSDGVFAIRGVRQISSAGGRRSQGQTRIASHHTARDAGAGACSTQRCTSLHPLFELRRCGIDGIAGDTERHRAAFAELVDHAHGVFLLRRNIEIAIVPFFVGEASDREG
jgi:hypothetical protein